MKFSQVIKNQTVTYRLCDELTCKSIAVYVVNGKYLCESHTYNMKQSLIKSLDEKELSKKIKEQVDELHKIGDALFSTEDLGSRRIHQIAGNLESLVSLINEEAIDESYS